jgi:hypothetical protein
MHIVLLILFCVRMLQKNYRSTQAIVQRIRAMYLMSEELRKNSTIYPDSITLKRSSIVFRSHRT